MSGRKRLPRLYAPQECIDGRIPLDSKQAHYLSKVLRLSRGDELVAFDGRGHEWHTTIGALSKRFAELVAIEPLEPLRESPLDFVLVQALTKSDAMDTIIRKATELGVSSILAVRTQYGVVNLSGERAARRTAHWEKIAQSACEQCGRHSIPDIKTPGTLADAVPIIASAELVVVPDPRWTAGPQSLPDRVGRVAAIIGPEGGLSPSDYNVIESCRPQRVRFGPRVLRADTAAVTVCAYVQNRWGDLG